MARYIDRKSAFKALEIFGDKRTLDEVYERLEKIPTADVVERKDLDEITEAHEQIGYEKGYADGRAARDAEIVRCKDCVYAIPYNERWTLPKKSNCLWCKLYEDIRTPGWYCADGERREG